MSPPRSYHDAVWDAVQENAVPSCAPVRRRFLLRRIAAERAHLGRAVRVLDIGCGDGYFALALLDAGAEVVAVDVAGEAVRRTRARCVATRAAAGYSGDPALLTARLLDADAPLPFADASFDAVWAGETIEHIADTAGWMSELRRVLRPRGVLLLSTPDHGPLARLWLALSGGAFAAHFDPRADHLRFYTRPALIELLADFGFEEVEVAGAGRVPGARRVLLGSARRTRF